MIMCVLILVKQPIRTLYPTYQGFRFDDFGILGHETIEYHLCTQTTKLSNQKKGFI
jgi:hypothetical protein